MKQCHIDILLSDGFVLTELAAILDPLRIANRALAQRLFSWSFHSAGGGMRATDAGVMVNTLDVPQRPAADYLIVLGNADPDHAALSVRQLLRNYTFAEAKVVLLSEAATRFISEEGRGEGLATHWENATLLRERMEVFEVEQVLACDQGPVVTCAGMEATVDLVLQIIAEFSSQALQATVADVLLHDSVRLPGTLQPSGSIQRRSTGDADLDRAVELMQDNIETPIPVSDIVAQLGISPRSLERKFKSRLGVSPVTFYREIRLHRANNLLLNTALEIREVGLACGFGSGFASLYKSVFGQTPSAVRRQQQARVAAE